MSLSEWRARRWVERRNKALRDTPTWRIMQELMGRGVSVNTLQWIEEEAREHEEEVDTP